MDGQSFCSVARQGISKLQKAIQEHKKHKEVDNISNACEQFLVELDKLAEPSNSQSPVDIQERFDYAALFIPFLAALELRNPKLSESALDCLHEFVAHGYLKDLTLRVDPPRSLAEVLVENVCACSSIEDDTVQMQVIRVLQTSVMCEPSIVHGANLLQCVRTCFNLHLGSSSQANQTAAKAALSRMINAMMNRLEGLPASACRHIEEPGSQDLHVSVPSTPEAARSSGPDDALPKQQEPTPSPSPNGAHMNGSGSNSKALEGDKVEETDFKSVEERDVYEVFHRLCRLSMKYEVVDSWVKPDETMNMQSKMLSLELLLSMLDQSGPKFKGSAKFITCIKQQLCMSLLKNGVSPAPRVFKAALQVFVTLILNFKTHLKQEIGVFFTTIFLRILESPHSTYQQKTMVLQLLHSIFRDPQTVVDVFVNYDCDLKQVDIFAKMLHQLTRTVQSGSGASKDAGYFTPEQEFQLRSRGTDALVSMVESMMRFSKLVEKDFIWLESGEILPRSMAKHESNEGGDLESSIDSRIADSEDVDPVLKQKEHKTQLQQGIKAFNLKPKKGIEILSSSGHLNKEPHAIAAWFHNQPNLDKKAIGEYMGEPDELNKAVLYAYVDMMSFANMTIDEALRHFLAGFWLPGEAQKIDRMMEKFAERFCKDTDSFSNADTAYVLAYSIIMLNTDAHSPKIAKKMTKEEFVRNNRGINDGMDLPPEFLEGIYDRIVANGFKVKEEEDMGASLSSDTEKSAHERYRAEAQQLMSTAQGLLKKAAGQSSDHFLISNKSEHVISMLEISWAPMLAAFSVLMEESAEAGLISQCLKGMTGAITLLSIFKLESQRDAFVSTLTQFTNLHGHTVREVRQKNVESILAAIAIARNLGNFLGSSWGPVLRCFSELDRLQLAGSGSRLGNVFGGSESSGSQGSRREWFEEKDNRRELEEANSLRLEQIDTAAIDRVFTSSARLSDEAIIDFVRQLVAVSHEEIESCPSAPRVYSMQKIVEITYFNMSRIRIVWSRIWSILGEHFQSVALAVNTELSMYVIDSMRQLALKFLEKDELTSFHFQRDFLKPFDFVIANSKTTEIRELVVRCLTQVVRSTARNIKSGWKIAFQVLNMAGRDESDAIVLLAFDLVRKVIHESFLQVISDPAHGHLAYADCLNCLGVFAKQQRSRDIALEAIDLMRLCNDIALEALGDEAGLTLFSDSERHVRIWFPILTGLAGLTSDPRLDVRSRALDKLFETLMAHGPKFDRSLWGHVFHGVLFPMFDDVYHVDEVADTEWLDTSFSAAMGHMTDMFVVCFEGASPLLQEFLRMLALCIVQHNERLAEMGVNSIKRLLSEAGRQFSPDMWAVTCGTVVELFERAGPVKEEELTSEVDTEERLRLVGSRHRKRMLLFQLVQDLCNEFCDVLAEAQILQLLNLLGSAQTNAIGLSGEAKERMGASQLLQWIYAESAEASRSELQFMLGAYATAKENSRYLEARLLERLLEVLREYTGLTAQDQRGKWEEEAAGVGDAEGRKEDVEASPYREQIRWILAPTVIVILEGLTGLEQQRFERLLPHVYPLLCALVEGNDSRVRSLLACVFLQRVGPALKIMA